MAVHLTIKSAGLHRIPVTEVDKEKVAKMVLIAVSEQSDGRRI